MESSWDWMKKKLGQTLTFCMTLWMIADMMLDCLSCYNFYEMCLVTKCQHQRISLLFTELNIIQDNDRNFTALNISRPEYLNSTGPVSCVYWRASLGKS